MAPHHLVLCFRLKVARAANREPQHRPQHTVVMVEKAAQVEQVARQNTEHLIPLSLRELRITTIYSLMEKVVTAHNSVEVLAATALLLAAATAVCTVVVAVLMMVPLEQVVNMVEKVALVAKKA